MNEQNAAFSDKTTRKPLLCAQQRAEQISRRHTDAITESVAELADLGLVKTAGAQVRVHGATSGPSSPATITIPNG